MPLLFHLSQMENDGYKVSQYLSTLGYNVFILGHLKIINFPFGTNGKFIIFRCPKIRAHYGIQSPVIWAVRAFGILIGWLLCSHSPNNVPLNVSIAAVRGAVRPSNTDWLVCDCAVT